jgi:hypothetical protein
MSNPQNPPELRRRAAIEPVIGHLKPEGHLDRNYLKGRHGDHANAVLTTTGHNLRLVLRWLRTLPVQIHRHPDRRHMAGLSAQNRLLTNDKLAAKLSEIAGHRTILGKEKLN